MHKAKSLRDVARRSALMLAFVLLSSCSSVTEPPEDSAASIDPSYTSLMATFIRTTLKGSATYQNFEISEPRWVHAVIGWSWLVCLRFQDQGHRRTYAFFIKGKAIADSRYAVQADACGAATYSPFNLMADATGAGAVGGQGPLY
jgi:hypothetical protein